MAAPVPVVAGFPATTKMPDGYKTIVTCSGNRNLSFWEIEVTPPGLDGGDPIEVTTMRNFLWRQMAARSLQTLTAMSITAAWNTALYAELTVPLTPILNNNMTWTILFRDLSSVSFYGVLNKFDPQSLKEGDFPQVQLTVTPTNTDPGDGSEEGPVWLRLPF